MVGLDTMEEQSTQWYAYIFECSYCLQMGDSINMAARLMCHPEAAENMLCDEKTYNLCIDEFQFSPLGETKVKGKSHPISIFRPTSILKDPIKKDDVKKADLANTTIGRTKEKAAIVNMVGKLINRDTTGILVIEADGGQGLSTLYDLTRVEATIRGCILVYVTNYTINTNYLDAG